MLIKNILLICLVSAMISCGNNNSSQPAKDIANTDNENVSDIEMFKATDCATCHKKTESFVGPSFADIAERYPNAADTTIETLVQTIIKGSSGKWKTTVAEMPAHPALPKADAENMVKYILQVKK